MTLRDHPTNLPVVQVKHIHEPNEVKRKLDVLAQARQALEQVANDNSRPVPDLHLAQTLLYDIRKAVEVQWKPQTEHNFSHGFMAVVNDKGFVVDTPEKHVREYTIGYYDIGCMNRVLDELSTSPLLPDHLFMSLIKAEKIAYSVTPVKWMRVPKEGTPNGVMIDTPQPEYAVEFSTKQEAADFMRTVFPQRHPDCLPRVALA